MSEYRLNTHFLMRRLHSLFGVVPVGAFLIFHLWENSQSRFGSVHYNEQVVATLQGLNYLPFLELFAIALPLLFHATYGLVILRSGKAELRAYPWLHHRFYWLQRVSGVGILLFLLFHVGMTRLWGLWELNIHIDMFSHMHQLLSNPLLLLLYILGLLLAVFHLGNGLWNMSITWGVFVTPGAQHRSFIVSMILTLILFAMGLHGIWGFLA